MIFQSKRKKECKAVDNRKHDPKDQYYTSMDTMLRYLNITADKNEKIMLLDYYIKVIKKDIEADDLSFMIYPESNKSGQYNNIPKLPLFSHYYDNDKKAVMSMNDSEIMEIDLSDTDIVVLTTDNRKIYQNLLDLSKYSDPKPVINQAIYMKYVNLCFFKCGHHQMAVRKMYNTQCRFEVLDYKIENAFADVSTNGADWEHRYFDENERVYDFRMSVIYTLAKLKYYYENEQDFYDRYIKIDSDGSFSMLKQEFFCHVAEKKS